jgi:ATP-binding cassette subfamily B protein
VWRRLGLWLQLMDPATGRRWVRERDFAADVLRHTMSLPEADWRSWAASAENTAALAQRLQNLGASAPEAQALVQRATDSASWFPLAALDASQRLAQAVVQAGGLPRGAAAVQLAQTLFERTCVEAEDIFRFVPAAYWSATPDVDNDPANAKPDEQRLNVRGAVLMRVAGRTGSAAAGTATATATSPPADTPAPLSRELAAVLSEPQEHPMRTIWKLLREDGLLGPVAMAGAMAIAAGALVAETLLFRGIFEIAGELGLASQRLLALLALLAFAALLLCIELPIVTESLRYGRHLETRLRAALLAKLPRLNDRYFQSRSIADMAERSHSIQLARTVPMLGLNFVQTTVELLLTLAGVALVAPSSTPWALAIVAVSLAVPSLLQPLLGERDLRLRNHSAALNGFYLDALLGAVPVRTHRAQRAVRRQHESLLVEWARSSRSTIAATVGAGTLQSALCLGLAAALLVDHFARTRGVSGGDLLLVYWALKLPALGGGVGGLARQYPMQRNVLMRLFEPLTAPEDLPSAGGPMAQGLTTETSASLSPQPSAAPNPAGAAIRIEAGRVLAGGHAILNDVDLHIAPCEHVAIVGASGAGKSSLVGLLLGWHRLAEGHLTVDGQPLDAAAQETLRRQTAWVDPGVQLWNASFLDNLGYASGDDALSRVGEVLTAARLRGVLAKLPQGLQTPLGEGGARLSGGEGQRVRLGRAMLQAGVRLALLDEPFRGLDRGQRSEMLADARRWWQHSTLLCVTHDVGETLGFGRVLVVDEGRIVEDGVPTELAAGDTAYARLLQAEAQVRSAMWHSDGDKQADAAPTWRQVRIEGGLAVEAGADAAAGCH